MKLILASSSPRRAEILRNAGIAFDVSAPEVNEQPHPGESADAMVARLSEEKARAVAGQLHGDHKDAIVVGADTAVEMAGEIFGKPRDAAHAREMLRKFSGHTHRVLTGLFLIRLPDGTVRSAVESTSVTFDLLDPGEIEACLAGNEPLDKAGAYAIQGRAGKHIRAIEGCYFNVVGLPLAKLYKLLKELGWSAHSI
jgi:septum formation protein